MRLFLVFDFYNSILKFKLIYLFLFFLLIYISHLPLIMGQFSPVKSSQNAFFTFMQRQDEEKQQRVYKQRLLKTFRTDKLN